jgi:hypothetical protein
MKPILSVLIPSIPERLTQAMELFKRIEKVMEGHEVEILLLMDNLKNPIGQKREKLKNAASGKYFAFVDDDDNIDWNYNLICEVINYSEPDIICFKQIARLINENEDGYNLTGTIDFSIHNENEQFKADEITKRKPFPCCVWKTELVQDIPFNHSSYGEDADWAERALERIKTEHKIDAILHYYNFNSKISRAEN